MHDRGHGSQVGRAPASRHYAGPGKRFQETRGSDAITTFSYTRANLAYSKRQNVLSCAVVPVVVSVMGMASLLSAF